VTIDRQTTNKLWWFVAVPAWLLFTALAVSGSWMEMQWLAILCFAVFAVPTAIKLHYFWRDR
jgi:hypothetical protein